MTATNVHAANRFAYHPKSCMVGPMLKRLFKPRISPLAKRLLADNLTYLPHRKLARIEKALTRTAQLDGAIVEFGVALGGSAILMAQDGRPFHGFDLFGMIPPPTSERDDAKSRERYSAIAAGRSEGLGGETYYGYRDDLLGDVKASFAKYGVPVDGSRISLHEGLFEDRWPHVDTGPISLAHIDCDWFDPVQFCLDAVKDLMEVGGLIVLDDYHDYGGAKEAVDDFRKANPNFAFEDGPNPILLRLN